MPISRVGKVEYNLVLVTVNRSTKWNEMVLSSSRRFSIEISYNQNVFDTLILLITGSPAFKGYEVC